MIFCWLVQSPSSSNQIRFEGIRDGFGCGGRTRGGGGGAYPKLLNFTTCSKEDMAEGAWLWGIFQVD